MHKATKLLLTIDLGNSASTYGLFDGQQLLAHGFVHSDNIPFFNSLVVKSGIYKPVGKVIISSVVPKLSQKLKKSIGITLGERSIYVVGKDVKLKVPMRYNVKQLGPDRLVNIYGARELYRLPLLIIDFGTAITFDYVSKSGIFEGGLIVPGIETSFRALIERAALLPKLKQIAPVKRLAGRNTESALASGILNGFGALADGLIGRFRATYSRKLKVLATGGFAARIAPFTAHVDYVDPLHTIRSLALIYRKEIK
jgi:type III pantothenate kinase